MEENGLFSDIEIVKTLIQKLPTMEIVKSGFNNSSQTKVGNFIDLFGGVIVKFGSKELVLLLNNAFFGSKIKLKIKTASKMLFFIIKKIIKRKKENHVKS